MNKKEYGGFELTILSMARQGRALDRYLKFEYYMDMDDGFAERSTTQNVPVESAVTVSRRLTN
jgi:hypothetical protein